MEDALEDSPNQLEYLSLFLYAILTAEILFFAVAYNITVASGLLVILITLLWLRRTLVDDGLPTIAAVRAFLSSLLGSEEGHKGVRPLETSDISLTSHQISEDHKGIISQLRSIGIDGILVLIFLVKNDRSLCSISTIRSELDIPQSTLYRNMEQLHGSNLISKHQLLEDKSNYYQVTEFGKSVVEDLSLLVRILV